jgi:ribosome-associated toxin RatA of RatAB toxin-antitoxin module
MRRVLTVVAVLCCGPAAAQDLSGLLDQGHLVLVENDEAGKFKQCTAMIRVARPPAEVWAVVSDLGSFKTFIPKVKRSEVTRISETQLLVDWEIEVPLSNTRYTFRYDLDPEAHTLHGKWVKGDLKGSTVTWRVLPFEGGSLVKYTTATRNMSGLVRRFDDAQQTMTVGVNVGAALTAVRAVKARVEQGAPEK